MANVNAEQTIAKVRCWLHVVRKCWWKFFLVKVQLLYSVLSEGVIVHVIMKLHFCAKNIWENITVVIFALKKCTDNQRL